MKSKPRNLVKAKSRGFDVFMFSYLDRVLNPDFRIGKMVFPNHLFSMNYTCLVS